MPSPKTPPGYKSIPEVSRLAGGYPELTRRLCTHLKVPTIREGSRTYVPDNWVNELIWQTRQFRDRLRVHASAKPVSLGDVTLCPELDAGLVGAAAR